MKLPLILLILLQLPSAALAQFYDRCVRIPDDAPQEIADAAEELAKWLTLGAGSEFTVGKGGISLRLAESDDAELADRGLEAFRIRGTNERLSIVGNSPKAVRHGVYVYLDKLGFRWLLPSESWTIAPNLATIQINVDEVHEPAFRLRNFFGTGGFGGRLPVDPEMRLQARWERWKEQNRFGGDVQLAGHAGEAFNHAHREILEANPEFFAEIDGKRQPWGVTTKLCTANPKVRELWVADRLKKLEADMARFPNDPRSASVSVEPADGADHCECAKCRKIGTVSDRAFDLANHTARAVAAKHPGKLVNLYAYNVHAAPPNFSVEPNVVVLVAPYAFQRTGLPGDELVKAWAPRANHLGVYDYWAIPDWANCEPVLAYERGTAKKIRFWHGQGVRAFLGESSFSAGNVGLTWYLASRLLWNPQADERAIVNEFFDLAYGPAQAPMRRMHERWAAGYLLSEHELALAFRDLAEARRLAPNSAIRARIDDFVLYAEYLRLWRAYWETEPKSPTRLDRADELIRYLWRIYPSAMVHSFRMYQLIALRHERGNPRLLEKWPQKDASAAAWQNLAEPDEVEVAAMLENGLRDFTPLEFEPREFGEKLQPLHRPEKISDELVQTPEFAGTHEFEFWAPPEVDRIVLPMRCGKREDYPGNLVLVLGPDGEEIHRHTAPSDGAWHDLTIPISQSGNHRMIIHDQKIFFRLKAPRNLPFVVKGWKASPALPAKVYFQVPPGISNLAIAQESVVPLKIHDATGNEVAQSPKKLFLVEIPASAGGEIWSLSNFKTYRPLRLLNAANVFSFAKEGMMVPVE